MQRKPSFFPCDLCSRNSAARLVTFSQLHVLLFTFWRSLPWQQRVQNIRLFWYFFSFFYNFSSFLRWKCFKICTGDNIDLTLLISYFLKIICSQLYFLTFKKICSIEFFEKIELKRYNLCLELYKLLKKFTKETEDICVHFRAFLRIWRHTFPGLSINFPPN